VRKIPPIKTNEEKIIVWAGRLQSVKGSTEVLGAEGDFVVQLDTR
jgi:hypothetical protein